MKAVLFHKTSLESQELVETRYLRTPGKAILHFFSLNFDRETDQQKSDIIWQD